MKVVAHRGFSARYPENSLASFDAAIAAGADYVETDVRMTSDGVLVCSHDPDLKRIAGRETKIADTAVQALEAIALPGGGHILRLDAVLAHVRGRAPVMLDVKIDDDRGRHAIIERVTAAGMTGHVVYGVRSAEHARALIADGATFARLAMPAEPAMLDAFPADGLVGVRLWEDQVDAAAIARIRARELPVWVTAGVRKQGEAPGFITAERLQALRSLGIDAVLVNDVALAVGVARGRG
jgi:glycerophosphoryl diester phosphodiesterase